VFPARFLTAFIQQNGFVQRRLPEVQTPDPKYIVVVFEMFALRRSMRVL
jgi:hypothetical protein